MTNKGRPKGISRPAIVYKLRDFIEEEFAKYGDIGHDGKRRISLAPRLRMIASVLGVSEGTIKNSLLALRQDGYILSAQTGMYFVLASTDSPSSKATTRPVQTDDGTLVWSEAGGTFELIDAESRRLPVDDLTYVLRQLLASDGMKAGDNFIEQHRTWCYLNGLQPHI